ncbi:MAG: serpin family protein [Acidimicrobiales bacterium]|nr:serpin family protein [Acidimicrobiales bacterium]
MSRRTLRVLAAIVTCAVVAAACGDDDASTTNDPDPTTTAPTSTSPPSVGEPVVPMVLPVADRADSATDPAIAGEAISAFGLDLLGALRTDSPEANVAASPTSIAIALAMLEPGASGAAVEQLHELLRIDDPTRWHQSMSALETSIEDREPWPGNDGDEPGEVIARIANAAYLQTGYPFEPAYLEAIGRAYGPVLNEVDFEPDPDAVGHAINEFVADATNERITDLIADGVIDPATVLALVNALYFKASWLETFDAEATEDGSFTRFDGSTVTVPMMTGESSGSLQGDGWVGAEKSYVGGFAVQFVLPEEGRFDEIAADLDAVFADWQSHPSSRSLLVVPRFETRVNTELSDALMALGLDAPYASGGLNGIASDPRLVIDRVIHETFLAMDEEGTEAAAATVVLAFPTSAGGPPVDVELDRPFLFRIIDGESGATLFIGQVADPTA